ncbi:MAG: hypothetical protein STSR0008_00440 [Ignavibacterium sp.]
MKKLSLFILIFTLTLSITINSFAQIKYKVEKVSGNVKVQVGTSEDWIDVEPGMILNSNSVLLTNNKSFITISNNDLRFTLKPSAALNVSNIKKMTIDELLLALAMEEILNAPVKKNDSKARTTVSYGSEINSKNEGSVKVDNFGLLRLNGAKQLAENGFKESAVAFAMETYRKYPNTRTLKDYRLYFANILYELKLYRESLTEYNQIKQLDLTESEKKEVNLRLETLAKNISGI